MNYWIITTEFPPFHGGGISTYNLHTGLMLVEQGHNVTVFVPDHSISNISKETFSKINVIRFKPGRKEYYAYLGYSSALSLEFADILLDEIAKNKNLPDFIETQDYHGIGYYLILKKKLGEPSLQNIPIVLTAHAPSFYYLDCNQAPIFSLPDYWTGEMEKWTMQAADILISPSEYLVDAIRPYLNGYDKNYHVIRNPYKELLPSILNFEDVNKQEDIIFFGKLTYQKGCLQLLKFLSKLWDNGCNKKISFIGDDHYFEPKQINMRDYLITKFKRFYEKGYFIFEGKLNLEQLNVRLSKASLIIVPSLVDNFPYAVVESMLKGKLLLISDGGGQREMVEDSKSGFIYNVNDFNDFKNKFEIATSISSAEAYNLGKNAIDRINALCNYNKVYEHKLFVLNNFKQKQNSIFPFVHSINKAKYNTYTDDKKDLLSIIVPYYNTGKYITETIENLKTISYENIEIIVVNDGSDEESSLEVLYNLQKKYNLKVINQENSGLAEARNTGVRNSNGEFVAFLDADDKIHSDFYKRAIEILRKYDNVSFVSSWVQYFDSNNGIWPANNPEPPFLLLQNMVNAGFLCRRLDYLNFAINDKAFEYGMEDYDANLSLLENGCRGVVIPEPLYYYRIHAASMARGFNKFNRLFLYRIMSKKHQKLYKEFGYETFNLLLANGPSYLYDNPSLKPATDIEEYKKRINDLEEAVGWYDRTLNYYKNNLDKASGEINIEKIEVPKASFSNLEELKLWYHKEYEVLPLWYKRIGHIIKAFKGHRTFRSLINK